MIEIGVNLRDAVYALCMAAVALAWLWWIYRISCR